MTRSPFAALAMALTATMTVAATALTIGPVAKAQTSAAQTLATESSAVQAPAQSPAAQSPAAKSPTAQAPAGKLPPGHTSAIADAVKAAELKRFDALTRNDLDTLATLLHDELSYVHSSGTPDTKASYIETLRSGRTRYNTITPSDLTVRVFGNTAIINGTARMTVTSNGEPRQNHLIFTDVWVQRNNAWQMVSWQSTRMPEM